MGGGYGGGGRGRVYTYRYTVTTRMTCIKMGSNEMRAILMFHNCEGQSHKTVSTNHNFWRERKVEAVSNRGPSAYQPTALPLGHTGSHSPGSGRCAFIRNPFHLRASAVAHKGCRSFCQKCRWQVAVKPDCTLRVWLCTKRRDGAWSPDPTPPLKRICFQTDRIGFPLS